MNSHYINKLTRLAPKIKKLNSVAHKRIVLELIKIDPTLFKDLDIGSRGDAEIVGIALSHDNMEFVARGLMNDKYFVELASVRHENAIMYASNNLRLNPDFNLELISANHRVITNIHPDLKTLSFYRRAFKTNKKSAGLWFVDTRFFNWCITMLYCIISTSIIYVLFF